MNKNENYGILNINQTSYTWKEEYVLPYESYWSRIAKFCFLNGISWFAVQRDRKLKSLIHESQSQTFDFDIPLFYFVKPTEYGMHYSFSVNYGVHKICPMCMKYGYHSVLHEVEGLDYCVFHKCRLMRIDSEKFYESRHGTYEFCDVKIEDVVRNDRIFWEIQKFIHKQEKEKLLSSNYISLNPNAKNSNRCYESTERLYQKLVLLQDDIGLYGCKCVCSIQNKDIERINNELLEHIMELHISSIKDKDYYFVSYRDKSHDALMRFITTYYIKKGVHGENILKDDLLGWCFITIVTEAIQECFDNLDDWNITFDRLFYETNMYLKNKREIRKIAVALAYQAITGTASPEKVQQNYSRYWTKTALLSRYGLPVYDELGALDKSRPFHKGSPTEAGQYVLYPILKDLFSELVSQATKIIKQNRNIIDKKFLRSLNPDMWITPQYAVFYYQNKAEIYRCEPEYNE